MSIDMAAFLRVRLVTRRICRLDFRPTADLAGRERGLASTCGLESITSGLAGPQQPQFSLRCRGLRHFRQIPETSLRLTGVEPATFRLSVCCSTTELLATYGDVRLQLLDDLLDHRIQHTACLSPRGLLSRPSRAACLLRGPRPTRSACRPRLRGSDVHATLSDTRWRVGVARPDATTRFLFPDLRSHSLAAAAGRPRFFALHSRPD